MTAQPLDLDPPTLPLCVYCAAGDYLECLVQVPTGRKVPDPDPYRDRDRFLVEYRVCGCPCREGK